jgi:hypothetical protein
MAKKEQDGGPGATLPNVILDYYGKVERRKSSEWKDILLVLFVVAAGIGGSVTVLYFLAQMGLIMGR